MNPIIFLNTFEVFRNFLMILKIPFSKKNSGYYPKIISVAQKFPNLIWNLVTKRCPEFVTFCSFLKIPKKKLSITKKKIVQIHIDSKKSLNSFNIKTRIGYQFICWKIFVY